MVYFYLTSSDCLLNVELNKALCRGGDQCGCRRHIPVRSGDIDMADVGRQSQYILIYVDILLLPALQGGCDECMPLIPISE